jgi:peptidoglycan/LPS O-acetylase OafA/YrhL
MRATIKQTGGVLPALTSIRFLAALTVVLSHYSELGLMSVPGAFFSFVDGGRPAVSLFFVLSGFILTYTYRDSLATGGRKSFYAARFARIYPVVLFGLMLTVPVTAVLLFTGNTALLLDWYALKNSVYVSLALSFVVQLLLLNAWFPFAAINQPWNGPSDSVSCEAFFYALFPLLLRRFVTMRPAMLCLTFFGFWLGQGLLITFIEHALPASRSGFLVVGLPLARISEFVLGMCAAIAYQSMRARTTSLHVRAMLLVTLSLAAIAGLAWWHPLSPAYFLEAPFFAALILGLAMLERPVTGLLNQRWLVRLGEASYSLYLIHVPVAYLAYLAGFRLANGWVVLVFAVLLSVVVFRFYEEPMRRRIRARLSGTPHVVPTGRAWTPADLHVPAGPSSHISET